MKYILIILTLFSFLSKAEIPLEIIGNNSTLSDVMARLDLLRVCSNPTDNDPNFYVQRNENVIELRISITYSHIIPCDPPPPQFTSYIEVNLGHLNSGHYQLNILFVDSDESVITGTPLILKPYHQPFYFHVPYAIPTMNWWFSLMLIITLISITYSYLQSKNQRLY